MTQRAPHCLLLLLLGALILPGCPTRGGRGDDDDDDSAADDDDSADDDDATANDDDATGDDDDATAGPANPGDVLVTEVMTNPAAVDDDFGEWLELFNATGAAIDLSGWTLADRESDTVVLSPSAPLVIAPGGYIVLGRDPSLATNGGVSLDWSYGTAITLANGADEVVLFSPAGTEIFGLDYTDSLPNPAGASSIYPGSPAYPAIGNEANWCATPTSGPTYGSGDFGSPGGANGGC